MSNYSNDTKPSVSIGTSISQGTPIGMMLALTYASTVVTDGYVWDLEPTANSYSLDSKPS